MTVNETLKKYFKREMISVKYLYKPEKKIDLNKYKKLKTKCDLK